METNVDMFVHVAMELNAITSLENVLAQQVGWAIPAIKNVKLVTGEKTARKYVTVKTARNVIT